MLHFDENSRHFAELVPPLSPDGLGERSVYAIAAERAYAHHTQLVDPIEQPPDPALLALYGAANCLKHGVMPWRRIAGQTIVLAIKAEHFHQHREALQGTFGPVMFAITTEEHLAQSVSEICGQALVVEAERKVPDAESCRNWNSRTALAIGVVVVVLGFVAAALAPQLFFATLTAWAVLTLALNTGLKAAAAVAGCHSSQTIPTIMPDADLPVITMMVPLFKETAIADHLLARLKALDYPRALLDVCIVLEADDETTRATLGKTTLPTWLRPIIVPTGTVKTKPRALNYALDFARGDIIGVWDAEDAPAPDQLRKVADRFANCHPDVACLQGILDYYNARANWLTRCFTVEYASWFRVVLPGLERLGLVVPLGGTTLFFRRAILERLGGWDAHNVTEDADLGVRLARQGYRTELINTVTEEEANGRFWPWIKQRSRWLKGYAITYGVHMRNPRKLLRDLGPWRFFGVQLLFLGTLSQFLLAPVLWSFWLLPLGFGHPLSAHLTPVVFWSLGGLFVASELVGFGVATIGVSKARKTWLIKWAPTLHFYFPMAAAAAYKGFYELITRPFYWDKTAHGVLLPSDWQATPPPQQPLRPASNG